MIKKLWREQKNMKKEWNDKATGSIQTCMTTQLQTFKQINLKLRITTNMVPNSIPKLQIAQTTTPYLDLADTERDSELSVLNTI